jgi:hypothetical protein
MYGTMKIVRLGEGRYVGLPKHIAMRIVEGTNWKGLINDDNSVVFRLVEEEDYARDDTTRVRNRTTYDDQKWMRIPTAMIRQLDSLWAIGEEVLVKFDAKEFELHVQPLAARAAARRATA